jgi:hypothetical protein
VFQSLLASEATESVLSTKMKTVMKKTIGCWRTIVGCIFSPDPQFWREIAEPQMSTLTFLFFCNFFDPFLTYTISYIKGQHFSSIVVMPHSLFSFSLWPTSKTNFIQTMEVLGLKQTNKNSSRL